VRLLWMMAMIGVFAAIAKRGGFGDFESRVKHGYADSNGVKIHYATIGSGPLVIMIHGFPDYWYSWRHQMEALADHTRWSRWISADTISATSRRASRTTT
jgi:hypothetical protein